MFENHPWIRLTSHFVALPEKRRPDGSAFDSQYFKEQTTGSLWIGKFSLLSEGSYRVEFLEVLGAHCYRHLGSKLLKLLLVFNL
jgi:hypothetical protein